MRGTALLGRCWGRGLRLICLGLSRLCCCKASLDCFICCACCLEAGFSRLVPRPAPDSLSDARARSIRDCAYTSGMGGSQGASSPYDAAVASAATPCRGELPSGGRYSARRARSGRPARLRCPLRRALLLVSTVACSKHSPLQRFGLVEPLPAIVAHCSLEQRCTLCLRFRICPAESVEPILSQPHVSFAMQKKLHTPRVTVHCCRHQWCRTAHIGQVDNRASGQQHLHTCVMSALCCHPQGGEPRSVLQVEIGIEPRVSTQATSP